MDFNVSSKILLLRHFKVKLVMCHSDNCCKRKGAINVAHRLGKSDTVYRINVVFFLK